MAFIRKFDLRKAATGNELWERLLADVRAGEVFPAVRKGRIDFYYAGGLLYSFDGARFDRSPEYGKDKYSFGTDGLGFYEKAKAQNENRFLRSSGEASERRLLNDLYKHTFSANRNTRTVVLDIEVCFSGEEGVKKCDLVLLDTTMRGIVFVEGKVFSDPRVLTLATRTPEVIDQVRGYNDAVKSEARNIEMQYGEHIRIVNALFGSDYDPRVTLSESVKLLVYGVPHALTVNGESSVNKINAALGAGNVAWYKAGEEPSIDEIRSALCE